MDSKSINFFEMINKSEEEINALFDSGVFNSIAIGYAKIALKELAVDKAELQRFEKQMKGAFDIYSAKDARKASYDF